VERLYDFDPAILFGVWLPTASTLSQIKLAIDFRDEALIRGLVAKSLTNSVQSPADARFAMAKPQKLGYGAAERNLMRAIEGVRIPLCNSVRTAFEQLNNVFDEDVLQKLHQEAAAAAAPEVRFLQLVAAALADAWYQRQPIVVAARRVMADEPSQFPTELSPGDLKDLYGIIDKMLKIFNALERHKR
jgi:hypothetical protein